MFVLIIVIVIVFSCVSGEVSTECCRQMFFTCVFNDVGFDVRGANGSGGHIVHQKIDLHETNAG